MTRNALLVAALWLATTQGCLTVGCNSTPKTEAERQGTFDRQMAALRAGQFHGAVEINTGGSPFGINACTNWSLGPQQMSFQASGDIDFRGAATTNSGLMPLPEEWARAVDNNFVKLHQRLNALESK